MIGAITTVCFNKEAIFSINLWSKFQQNFLFRGAIINDSGVCLDAKTSPSYVRYHTSNNTMIHQIIRKIKSGINGGLKKRFLQNKI